MSTANSTVTRFIGLDVHKRSVMVGAVDAQQQIVVRPFRNRLQSLLHRHNLTPPEGELFTVAHHTWWQQLTLVGYAGLGTTVHDSADTHHHGGITKQGRCDLRAVMVEAAWTTVAHNLYWKARFEQLCRHVSKGKAIVAIARQMLVVVWHAWHDREPDQHTDVVAIARKFLTWAEQGCKAMRQGLTATQFVRLQLDRLGIGQDLRELHYGSHLYKLPSTGSAKAANTH